MRSLIHVSIAAIVLIFPATPTIAGEAPIHTDANLVTALDVSDSIMRHEEWLQFEGLAKAVVNDAVLDAIAGGRHGQIGFAVLTWSSADRFELVVPWTLIASIDDAEQVAAALRGVGIERSSWQRDPKNSGGSSTTPEFRTDVSRTIDIAVQLALAAPYASRRTVVNVCANGADNVAEDPRAARDRAVGAGVVINGLVIDRKNGLAEYFRERVQGGVGSFVKKVTQPAALAEAMIDKLLRDLIATSQLTSGPVPVT